MTETRWVIKRPRYKGSRADFGAVVSETELTFIVREAEYWRTWRKDDVIAVFPNKESARAAAAKAKAEWDRCTPAVDACYATYQSLIQHRNKCWTDQIVNHPDAVTAKSVSPV